MLFPGGAGTGGVVFSSDDGVSFSFTKVYILPVFPVIVFAFGVPSPCKKKNTISMTKL